MDHDKAVNKTPHIDPEDMERRMDKHDDEADEDEEANDSNINSLKQKLETVEKELEETRHTSDQRLHQYKRSSDLAKNKIATATRCLNMYLGETLMTEKVDEFSTTFKFLVSQYSSLLFTPEGYTVDPDTNSITLNENLFSDLKGDDNFDFVKEKVKVFENHLKEKLSMDLSIRRERRLSSIGSGARPRLLSTSDLEMKVLRADLKLPNHRDLLHQFLHEFKDECLKNFVH